MNRATISNALPLMIGALFFASPLQGQAKGKEKTAEHGKHAGQVRDANKENKGKSAALTKGKSDVAKGEQRATGRDVARDKRDKSAPGRVVSEVAGTLGSSDEKGRGKFMRSVTQGELRPRLRPLVTSDKHSERFVGRAVALASLRGVSDDDLRITPVGSRVHVKNKKGDMLMDLDEDRARNMGAWRVVALDGKSKGDGPAFCRSGAGHPVWGRQWCLDKGFGIGAESEMRWGRVTDMGEIVLGRRAETNDLTRDVVAAVLGDVVFNRLAAHAITLGYTEPLTGRWIGEATGPRVLLVNAGSRTVAEIVDANRDDRADRLLIALRPW